MDTLLNLLSALGYAIDTPGAYTRGLLAGQPGERVSGQDMLKAWGVEDPGFWGGLGAEMIADPLNLIPAGMLTKGIRGATRAMKHNSMVDDMLRAGAVPAELSNKVVPGYRWMDPEGIPNSPGWELGPEGLRNAEQAIPEEMAANAGFVGDIPALRDSYIDRIISEDFRPSVRGTGGYPGPSPLLEPTDQGYISEIAQTANPFGYVNDYAPKFGLPEGFLDKYPMAQDRINPMFDMPFMQKVDDTIVRAHGDPTGQGMEILGSQKLGTPFSEMLQDMLNPSRMFHGLSARGVDPSKFGQISTGPGGAVEKAYLNLRGQPIHLSEDAGFDLTDIFKDAVGEMPPNLPASDVFEAAQELVPKLKIRENLASVLRPRGYDHLVDYLDRVHPVADDQVFLPYIAPSKQKPTNLHRYGLGLGASYNPMMANYRGSRNNY